MSGEELTPRATPASASKASTDKKTPKQQRSAKKVVDSGRKKKEDEEPDSEAEVGPSRGRSTRKREEEKKKDAVVTPANSDEEVKIVRTVTPRKPSSKAAAAPSAVKKEVDEESDLEILSDSDTEEQPTSSKAPARREKEKEKEKEKGKEMNTKPTRSGRAAGRAEAAVEEEEEERGNRTASRGRKGKKTAEEEKEPEKVMKGKRQASRPTTRKGRKAVSDDDEEEEEEEPVKTKKAAPAQSTRKGRKKAVEEEEEEEEQVEKRPIPSRRKDKRPVVEEEEETVQRRSTRWMIKKDKVVDADEEEKRKAKKGEKSTPRSTRKGKKAADSDEEEEEEMEEEEEEPVKNKREKDHQVLESEDETEEEESDGKKGIAVGGDEEEEGSSRSRARRRIDLGGEKEEKGGVKRGKATKALPPLESPEKKAAREKEERKKARAERRAQCDDEVEEVDVKPPIGFKPKFLDDLDINGDDDDDKRSDDEVTVVSSRGIPAASDVETKEVTESCIAICSTIRTSLKSVFVSKDKRAFAHAVKSIGWAQQKAYERDDYEVPSTAFYDEIENQLTNMMMKDVGETKAEVEGKLRVLKVIAKSFVKDFEKLDESQYEQYWDQIDYLLRRYTSAEDPHIRAFCCHWVSDICFFSKQCHEEEYGNISKAELEEQHQQRLRDEWARKDTKTTKGVDDDRRLIDGHMLKLPQRRRLYWSLYQALKHNDVQVRVAAIRGFSVIQDDPIPHNFIEAVKHSPKDLIMRQLMDVHVQVRKTAIHELRPTTDQQIEFLINAAMQEKHDDVRKDAFKQLGRLRIEQFNRTQRHALLAMLKDNTLGATIERQLLHSWLYEMVHGENPHPIIVKKKEDKEEPATKGKKKKGTDTETRDKWATAPLHLLQFLDCINHTEDILRILRKGAAIARKESGYSINGVSTWISTVIEECTREGLGQINMTEYSHLLDRDMSDDSRATIITFWLHCLQFVNENARDDGDRFDGLSQLSPSMGDLHKLIIACRPTSSTLQGVVNMLLSSFRYLQHAHRDELAMEEWRTLLMTLSTGEYCDLSPAIWKVVMGDLLKYHTKEAERDDLIYEVSCKMGFDFDSAKGEATGRGKGGEKSPRKHTKSPSKMATNEASSSREEEEQKRVEDRRFVLSRPDILGMLYGALKTGYFKSSADESIAIVFKTELDFYRNVSDNHMQALCLECIGMYSLFSSEMAEEFIGLVMENLYKPASSMDEEGPTEEVAVVEEEEKTKKRRKKIERVNQDELEVQYERREKEERERMEAERRSKRGGRNHCRGLALVLFSDLIVAHTRTKVDQWLESNGKGYTSFGVFAHMETLAVDQDLDLAFMVAATTFKLVLHDRELMRQLNKTVALLTFRALHPSSFAHSKYRACVLMFFPHFGSKSKENQMALTEVLIEMLSMVKLRSLEYKNVIDKGVNAISPFYYVSSSFAPSSLSKKHPLTAHAVLLKKLGEYLEMASVDAREGIRVDMDHYKALLNAILGMEFSGVNAMSLRNIYNVLHSNLELLSQWDKGGEARKLGIRVCKKAEQALDILNEIIRLNKAVGVIPEDDRVILPYEDETLEVINKLRQNALDMGKDIGQVSPVKDGRVRVGRASEWTPAVKKRGGKGMGSEKKALLSTVKKEPAKSKSYAASAAAERREAAAAALATTTPARASTRLATRKRPAMSVIAESDSDD